MGNIVIIRTTNYELEFGEIRKIIWQENRAYLLIEHLENLGFQFHFYCYAISSVNEPKFSFLSVADLLDFHPSDRVSKSGYAHDFRRLRYYVM